MMQSPDLERTARLIAENVVSAVEREQETTPFQPPLHPLIREALMVKLLRELLRVMPTQSGAVLADACNQCLDRFTSLKFSAARVEAIDPDDGSVAMREG
jgi:hypothetical protein